MYRNLTDDFRNQIITGSHHDSSIPPSIVRVPCVFVVMINYSGWVDTIECLESIFRSDYCPHIRVVIVDNNSPDSSVELITQWASGNLCRWLPTTNPMRGYSWPPVSKPIRYRVLNDETVYSGNDVIEPIIIVQAKENRGFSSGNNIGLRLVQAIVQSGDYIWLLNNDTVVGPNTVSGLVSFCKQSAQRQIAVGCKVHSYWQPHIIDSCAWGFLNLLTAKVSHLKSSIFSYKYLVGSNIFLTDCVPFDEEYFLYFEDIDYSIRLRQSRFLLACYEDSLLYHKVNASASKAIGCKNYKIESMVRFYCNHYPTLLPLVALMRVFIYLFSGRIGLLKFLIKVLKRLL